MSGKRAAPWIFLMWSSSERMTVVVRVFINRWWPHSEQHQRPMGALNSTSLLSLSFWGWKWSNCGSSERARWIFSCCLVCRVHAELTVRRVRLQLRFSGNLSWLCWILFIFNASEGEGALRTLSCSFCQNQTLLVGFQKNSFCHNTASDIRARFCSSHVHPSVSERCLWEPPPLTAAPRLKHFCPLFYLFRVSSAVLDCLTKTVFILDILHPCVVILSLFGHFSCLWTVAVSFQSLWLICVSL